jgi:carbohydrate kinase (thermoresistant glucokinase family)
VEEIVVSSAIVVMGVSGSGKSTVGRALSVRLGFEFIEGDQLHSPHNIERMASGHALSDAERMPWLNLVGAAMAQVRTDHRGVVAACSALKLSYRDVIRHHVPDAFFVALEAPIATIEARVLARPHSLLPPALIPSQFAALESLEPDERGIRLDATLSLELTVAAVVRALRAQR